MLKSELEYLGRVIDQVEEKTRGELRMMIVRRSGRVPLAAPLYFLSFSTLALIVMWFDRVQLLAAPEWTLPAVMAASAALGAALSRWPRAAGWMYGQIDRRIAAQTRAEIEFYRRGMTETRDRTGILIFVSLFERQAVVMADRGIAAKCPPSTWDGVVATIVQGARQQRWAPKLEDALRQCGELLAEHFPLLPDAAEPEPAAEVHAEFAPPMPAPHELVAASEVTVSAAPETPAPQPIVPEPVAQPMPPTVEAASVKPRWQQIDESAPTTFRKHKLNELPNDIIVDD